MNFGERLKQLRQEHSWSQPELATAIGIEQSYLSKLENDKSVPSPDMLNRILEAFNINLETLLEGMDENEIRKHFRSIPLVSSHLLALKESAQRKRTHWVIGSSLLCVLGITTIVLGIGYMADPLVIYDYGSEEIVPNGDDGETFETLEAFLQKMFAPTHAELISRNLGSGEMELVSIDEFENLRYEYGSLSTPAFQFSVAYRGNSFITDITGGQDLINLQSTGQTNGGTRTFELYNARSEMNSDWQGLNVGGAFLLALGIFGFIIDRKLFSKSS